MAKLQAIVLKKIKIIAALLLVLFSANSYAQLEPLTPEQKEIPEKFASLDKWGAEVTYAGYLGDFSIGFLREWRETHSVHLSVGYYDIDGIKYTQANLGYMYQTPWHHRFDDNPDLSWHFFSVGLYLLRSLDNTHYFRASPSKYPTAGYYDETALRFGLNMATSVRFWNDSTQISYFMMILDNGIIAAYNNQHERSLISYFVSHGLSLSYRF